MSRQPLRIAAIGMRGIPSNYSGIERGSENLYSILAERGHQVTIYCRPECLSTPVDVYRGMRLVRTPALDSRSAGTVSHVCSSFLHAIATRGYDIIQLHALAAGLFAPLKYLTSASVVAKIHGLDWQRAKWKGIGSKVLLQGERSIARHLDDIIVVSRQLESYFRDRYSRATSYIPNGVKDMDAAPLGKSTVLADFGLTSGEYIAYIGRLDPGKRVEDLIHAFRHLPKKWKLAIVGEGRYADDYVSKLQQLAAGDPRIVFTGLQGGSDLWTLFRQAAVFVSPSESEGLPNSLLECMAHGTPAIVSDIPPHREILGPVDGYGLFVRPGDVLQLQARLGQVLQDKEHHLQIARRAQSYVRASYSWQRSAEATESLYYAAASRSRLRALGRVERKLAAPEAR
ncbi:MAG: glycosyltransferase family 4 protein [Acidobacteriia bacterium]|nr:glycosyltransferase family 4 protein [Terriglobia bacterium]